MTRPPEGFDADDESPLADRQGEIVDWDIRDTTLTSLRRRKDGSYYITETDMCAESATASVAGHELTLADVLLGNATYSLAYHERVDGGVLATFIGRGALVSFRISDEVLDALQAHLDAAMPYLTDLGLPPRQTEA